MTYVSIVYILSLFNVFAARFYEMASRLPEFPPVITAKSCEGYLDNSSSWAVQS